MGLTFADTGVFGSTKQFKAHRQEETGTMSTELESNMGPLATVPTSLPL